MKEAVLRLLTGEKWTSRKAGLQLVSMMVDSGLTQDMDRVIQEAVRAQLEHEEARVRSQVAETLGIICKSKSARHKVWRSFSPLLLDLILDHEERGPPSSSDDVKTSSESAVFRPPKRNDVRHATEGWGPLDSSLRAVLHIINGFYDNLDEADIVDNEREAMQNSSESIDLLSASQSMLSASTSSLSSSSSLLPLFPISLELMEAVTRMTKHQNRFVRETCFLIISSLFEGEEKRRSHTLSLKSSRGEMKKSQSSNSNLSASSSGVYISILDFSQRLSSAVSDGLLDDWPHVVHAASAASRSILLHLRALSLPSPTSSLLNLLQSESNIRSSPHDGPEASNQNRENFQSIFYDCLITLIPPTCFNRYLSADGLRSYTLQTWKRLVVTEGPQIVSFLLPTLLPYYASLASHHNATTRETAAYLMGELMQKVPRARGGENVKNLQKTLQDEDFSDPQFAKTIGETLMMLASDASWPVREAACSSISLFISHISTAILESQSSSQSRAFDLSQIWRLLRDRLDDPLASVRRSSSLAILSPLRRLLSASSSSNSEQASLSSFFKMKSGGKDFGNDDSDSESDSEDEDSKKPSFHPSSPSEDKEVMVRRILKMVKNRLYEFKHSRVVSDGEIEETNLKSKNRAPAESAYIANSGEGYYGPKTKEKHDNAVAVHVEQEIFGCECHSTPHSCKAHPLTSSLRHVWESSQSALFLFQGLVQSLCEDAELETKNSQPSPLSPTLLQTHLSDLSEIISMLIGLLKGTKRNFEKYSTWQTSLIECLNSVLTSISSSASSLSSSSQRWIILINDEGRIESSSKCTHSSHKNGEGLTSNSDKKCSHSHRTESTWQSLVPILFALIASEERISSTPVSFVRPGAQPNLNAFHPPSAAPSSVVSGMPFNASPFSTNLALAAPSAPSYAAAIRPSLAKASSSLLVLDASAQLLILLNNIFGPSFVLNAPLETATSRVNGDGEEKENSADPSLLRPSLTPVSNSLRTSIWQRRCIPLLSIRKDHFDGPPF